MIFTQPDMNKEKHKETLITFQSSLHLEDHDILRSHTNIA